MRRPIAAITLAGLAFIFTRPGEGKAEPGMTVLKKYPIHHEITSASRVGDFGLMPEAGGFYRKYYMGSYQGSRDRDAQTEYLQVNDEVHGPYSYIMGEMYRRGGRYCFTYRKKTFPGRCCYSAGGACCAPLGLFPGCGLAFAYSPFYGVYQYFFDEHMGVIRNKGIGEFVVVNGRRFGPYDDVYSLDFPRTGEFFAFKYVEKGKDFFVLNGKVIGPFRSQYGNEIVVSDDGKRYAYHYRPDDAPTDAGFVVLDGEKHGPFSYANNFTFSGDGKSFAFLYSRGGRKILWRDGKEEYLGDREILVPKYPILTQGGFDEMFTPGSVEKRRGGYYIRRMGMLLGPYDKVGRLISSSDGKNFGFDYVKNDNHYVHVNGRNYGPYEKTYTPIVAEKGPAFWFSFNKDDKYYFYINGKNYGPFREPRLTASINIENFGIDYRSKEGGRRVLIQGREYGPYDCLDVTLRFSSDGSRWGIIYGKHVGSWHLGRYDSYIRFMDKDFGPYQAADLRFISGDRAIAGYIKDGHAFVAEIQ